MASYSRYFSEHTIDPLEASTFRAKFKKEFMVGEGLRVSKQEVDALLNPFGKISVRAELKKMSVPFSYESQEQQKVGGQRFKGFYHGFGIVPEINGIKEPDPVITPKLEVKSTKMKIPKKVKADVWNTYVGVDINKHRCLCCKRAYIFCNSDFSVGHVISEKDGGTLEISNLRPICSTCNSAMGTMNMVDFIKKYGYYL